MNEQKNVHITIFQAPFVFPIDLSLYMKMHDPKQPFQATVPAEYYLAVFGGEIECPKSLPVDKERRIYAILEQVFSVFNNTLPTGYGSHSLLAGDIVQLEGLHYLCVVCGFVPVTFMTSRRSTAIEARRHARCPCLMGRSYGQPPTRNLRIRVSISTLLLLMAQKTACVLWSTAWRRGPAMNCASVSIAQSVMKLSTITATI